MIVATVEPVPARNLELKVRCRDDDLGRLTELLRSRGATPLVTIDQVDTYFAVSRGRLKVRASTASDGVETAELIGYERPDLSGARWSSYTRVPLDASAAPGVIAALTDTVGLLTRVEKRRTVALDGETRVHLDRVAGLGAFVELETVLGDRTQEAAEVEYAAVVRLLGLADFVTVAGSYSDLVMANNQKE